MKCFDRLKFEIFDTFCRIAIFFDAFLKLLSVVSKFKICVEQT
jgi:hypothetical protein